MFLILTQWLAIVSILRNCHQVAAARLKRSAVVSEDKSIMIAIIFNK